MKNKMVDIEKIMSGELLSHGIQERKDYFIEPVYDTSIVDGNQQAIILQPTTKQVSLQTLTANSGLDTRNISFTVEVNNQMVDPYIKVLFNQTRFTIDLKTPLSTVPTDQTEFLTAMNNFEHISMKTFGLLNLVGGIKPNINGTDLSNFNSELPDIMGFYAAMADKHQEFSNGQYIGQPDKYQKYTDYLSSTPKESVSLHSSLPSLVERNANNSIFMGPDSFDEYAAGERRFTPIYDKANSTTSKLCFIVENLSIPISLTAFDMANYKSRSAIAGIRIMNLHLSLYKEIENLFSICPIVGGSGIVGTDEYAGIQMHLVEPPRLQYKELNLDEIEYDFLQKNGFVRDFSIPYTSVNTIFNRVDIVPTSSNVGGSISTSRKNIQFQSRVVGVLPEKLYLCIVKKKGSGSLDGNMYMASTPKTGLRMRHIRMSINNTITLFPDVDFINDMILRNGVKAFTKKDLNYNCGNSHVCVIDMQRDVSSLNQLFLNQLGTFSFEFQVDVENLTVDSASVDEEYNVFLFAENTRILNHSRGTFGITEFIPSADVTKFDNGKLLTSDRYLRNSVNIVYGGSFWSKIKSVGSWLGKNVPKGIELANNILSAYKTARGGSKPSGSTTIGGLRKGKTIGGASVSKIDPW